MIYIELKTQHENENFYKSWIKLQRRFKFCVKGEGN